MDARTKEIWSWILEVQKREWCLHWNAFPRIHEGCRVTIFLHLFHFLSFSSLPISHPDHRTKSFPIHLNPTIARLNNSTLFFPKTFSLQPPPLSLWKINRWILNLSYLSNKYLFHSRETFPSLLEKSSPRLFHEFSRREWGGRSEGSTSDEEREAVDPFERAADRRTRGFPEPRHSSESEPLPACLSDEPLWCRKPTREGADGVARVPPRMAPPCPATWTGCPHRPPRVSESRICGRSPGNRRLSPLSINYRSWSDVCTVCLDFSFDRTFSFLFFLWVRAKTCLQRLKRGKERGVFLQEGRDRHSRSDYQRFRFLSFFFLLQKWIDESMNFSRAKKKVRKSNWKQ